MDNLNETITAPVNDGIEESLPLKTFFADLKTNGFSVTTLQIVHAHKIIMQYANWVKNENELCMYLSPLFAGSEDEQQLFKQLFEKHFKTEPTVWEHTKAPSPPIEERLKRHWKKFIALYAFVAFVIMLVIIKTFVRTRYFNPEYIEISIRNKKDFSKISAEDVPLQAKTNEKVELLTECRYIKQKSPLETEVLYSWGDNSIADAQPWHIYTKPGKYDLIVYVNVLYKNAGIMKDTLHRVVNICSSGNSLTISSPNNLGQLSVGEKIKLEAIIKGEEKLVKISWTLDGYEIGTGKKLELSYKQAVEHSLICFAIYDSINSPCTLEEYVNLVIHNKKDLAKPGVQSNDTAVRKQADAVFNDEERRQYLSSLYKTLAALFLLISAFFIFLWFKELKKTGRIKSRVLDKYKKLTASFVSTQKPTVLPFKNRNYLPVQESEIDGITKLLRKRVKDTITFLHVEKTINRAIERAGFFEPVKEARTRQSEYLVLIDETNTDNQQVKLFEYLVVMLKKHNVLVEKFYYQKQPGLCYNVHEPHGVSLEKLYEKHQRHILLIFGNGYQLINDGKKEFDEHYAAILNHWQHKAIVTPVSFVDWQQEEKSILLPHIPIVPVDMEGLILLAEMLTEKENAFDIISRLKRNAGVFYNTADIDFYNVDALEKYCTVSGWTKMDESGAPVNVLFEWVAALAIYPKLRWEITLAIGNTILEKYGMHRQLNFTILLRIMRISWMQKGYMTDQLRFELLKKLSLENEKIARETILTLLKEIPQQEIKENSSNFEEKEVQQIINEFSLYANDPVFYSGYKESAYMFEKLWHDNLLKDTATTNYLKNDNQQWKTLINQYDRNTNTTYNTSVDEYLQTKEKEETVLSKVYLVLGLISIVVLLTSLGALRVLYIWDNVL